VPGRTIPHGVLGWQRQQNGDVFVVGSHNLAATKNQE